MQDFLNDSEKLREFIRTFESSSLEWIKVSHGDSSIELKSSKTAAATPAGVSAAVPPTLAAPSVTAPATKAAAAGGTIVTAPIVGTLYLTPSPDAPAYAGEGTIIKKGAVLCIIEAMKTMNELKAEYDMEILGVLQPNQAVVESGTPLFEVKRR